MPHGPCTEAVTPDDGVLAEFAVHRIERLVDLVFGKGDTAEEVALNEGLEVRHIVGAEAVQAEGAAIPLRGEARLGLGRISSCRA